MPTWSSASSTRALELGAAQPEVGRAEGDVLADRRHEQLVVRVLEDDADPAPDLRAGSLGRPAGPADRRPSPSPAAQDAVEVQDERGLAGAVGAEQRDPLAALRRQVDAEQRLVAVGVGEGEAARPPATAGCARAGSQPVHRQQTVTARAASGRAAAVRPLRAVGASRRR